MLRNISAISLVGQTAARSASMNSISLTCPAVVGDKLHQVETPALIVRYDALHRNLQRMKDFVASAQRPIQLRPHAKTHKCPALARLQVDQYGAVGMCCQKLDEAEALVEGGIADILITNAMVGFKKINRLCNLAKKGKSSSDDPMMSCC